MEKEKTLISESVVSKPEGQNTEEIENFVEVNEAWTIPSHFDKNKKPTKGCHIRVLRKGYYHHGIYKDKKHVYHLTGEFNPLKMKDAKPECTSLDEFLDKGTLEVRVYTEEQKKLKLPVAEILANAEKIISPDIEGNHIFKGYNLFTYNCECVANACVFIKDLGKKVRDYALILAFNKQDNK